MNVPVWTPQMLRDAMVVALRSADGPMTASALVPHMPWSRFRSDTDCTEYPTAAHYEHEKGRMVECHITWHVCEARPFTAQIYTHLVALEKRGIVRRAPGTVGRGVFWELTERGAAAEEIDELRKLVDFDYTPDSPVDRLTWPAAVGSGGAAIEWSQRGRIETDMERVLEAARESAGRSADRHVEFARQLEQTAEDLLVRARANRVRAEAFRDQVRRRGLE